MLKNTVVTLRFGAIALIHAKVPAALPTTTFVNVTANVNIVFKNANNVSGFLIKYFDLIDSLKMP